jgi:hypothetical protein
LSTVIVAAKKKKYFDEIIIIKSTNKSKTTWNTVKSITNNGNTSNNVAAMNINKNFCNPLVIANAFNTCFSSVVGNLIKNSFAKTLTNRVDPLIYLKTLASPLFQ